MRKKRGRKLISVLMAACTILGSSMMIQAEPVPGAGQSAELQNVALGKPVTGVQVNPYTSAAYVTDGRTSCVNEMDYCEIGTGMEQDPDDPYYIQVDLGQIYSIERVNLWRYYAGEPRTYHDTIVFVSEDTQFTEEDIVYNSDEGNFFGLGAGEDEEYVETASGLEISFEARDAQYIRVLNNGHTLYDQRGGHYVEIQAWAMAEKTPEAMGHADQPLDIPSFEAPGKVDGVTHPDIIQFDEPWNGYTYWMAVTPNQNGNSQFENPCLAASNDGQNWEVPTGISNPLTGVKEEPQPYHNCDVDMVYNEEDNSLYLYYVWSKDSPTAGQAGFEPSEVRLIKISHDGEKFVVTKPEAVVTSEYRYDILSPTIVIGEDGIWRMWSVDTGDTGYCNQSNTVELRTSEDGINWSESRSLSATFDQAGYQPWHIDVSYIAEKDQYWAMYPCYPDGGQSGYTELFFAESSDGEVWTTYEKPVMIPEAGAWDDDFIYRSTFLYDAKTDKISLWYSAGASQKWAVGYTENTYEQMKAQLGSAITPEIPSEPEDEIRIDEKDGVTFYGSWREYNDAKSYNGTARYSHDPEAYAEFTFTGTGFEWYGQKDSNFNYGKIYVDGEYVGIGNGNSVGSNPYQELYARVAGLENKEHTVRIYPCGPIEWLANGSENNLIDVDFFICKTGEDTADIPTEVYVTSEEISVKEGRSDTITAFSKDQETFTAAYPVHFEILDPEIASIEAEGPVCTVSGIAEGTTTLIISVPGTEIVKEIPVQIKSGQLPPKRISISNEDPLLIVPVYGQVYKESGSELSWGETLLGRWSQIPEDIRSNVVVEIHLGGFIGLGTNGNSTDREDAKRFYEQQLDIAEANGIPVMIVTATAGLVPMYTATDILDNAWLEDMMQTYDCLKGFIITENYWTDYNTVATRTADFLRIAAENGGYCIWSEHQTQVIEAVLRNTAFKDALEEYGDNFVFTWKNTPITQNAGTASYLQGLWLADVIDQWGGLPDTWKWWEKGYWKLFEEDPAPYYGTRAEECRAVVSEPEALLGIEMLTIYNNGGTVYNFEHPGYVFGCNDKNSPAFENVVADTFRYILENPAPDKEEILSGTKAIVHGDISQYSNSFHVGITTNDESLPTYITGRYGLIPAVPASISLEGVIDEAKVVDLTDDSLSTPEKRKEFFDALYPENYTGDAFAQRVNDAWVIYNSNVNVDVTQQAEVALGGQNIGVEVTPHTFTILSESSDGYSVYLNNYRVDKDSIWEGYTSSTEKWNTDINNLMQDWVANVYSVDPDDDEFRKTIYRIEGLTSVPQVIITRAMEDSYEEPVIDYNEESGEAVITIMSNGYMEFEIQTAESTVVDKTALSDLIDKAQGYVDDGTVDTLIESVKNIYLETLEKAKEILADEAATYEEVMDVQTKLAVCLTTVDMKAGDKTALGMLLESAAYFADDVLENYVDAGQAEFKAARDEAQAVYDDGDAFEDDVKAAYDRLFETMTALRMKADKTALKALIDMANDLNEADYTAESFAVMRTALSSAQAVYENDQATETEVKEAEADLRSAVDALVKADPSEETPGTDDGDQKPDGSSGTGDKTGGDKAAGGTPKTGDDVSAAGIIAAMTMALAGIAMVVIRKKKMN